MIDLAAIERSLKTYASRLAACPANDNARGQKDGYLARLREEAVTLCVAQTLAANKSNLIIPEFRLHELGDAWRWPTDRRARCDLYAYAHERGKGDELVVEVKKGGDGCSDLSAPQPFVAGLLSDAGKLTSLNYEKRSKLTALLLAVWSTEKPRLSDRRAPTKAASPSNHSTPLHVDSVRGDLEELYAQSDDSRAWPTNRLWRNRPKGQPASTQLAWLRDVVACASTNEPKWSHLAADDDPAFDYWVLAARFGK